MAEITGLTAARMLAMEAAVVVDGDVVGGSLILTRHDGTTINAGSVTGPSGPTGPAGTDTTVLTAQPILDVGQFGQQRAGRLLTLSDFTNLGLNAPTGLWPLTGTPDTSGNGRTLTNKGTVPFTAKGIQGVASTAALFAGNVAQSLYIADAGAGDPFRLRTLTVGCWFRTARTGAQALLGKYSTVDGQHCWWLQVTAGGTLEFTATPTGLGANNTQSLGYSIVTDNRWHFAAGVCDGSMLYLYVDGTLEGVTPISAPPFAGSGTFNIGSLSAAAANNGINPFFGRISNAFVSGDVLSEEQIRNLYCARITHALGAVPKRPSLRIRRLKKGAALVSGDFPTQPVRLYNFSAGALTDAGSNGQALTNNGGALASAGADGLAGNGFGFLAGVTQNLASTDTGLPSGSGSRSYGCWFKQPALQTSPALISWGAGATNAQALFITAAGLITARDPSSVDLTGPFVTDGQWHFAAVTEENAPVDGWKRKLYVDGKCVAGNASLNTITLAGASRFRIAHWSDGAGAGASFQGQIDAVFVCNYVLEPEEILALYNKASQTIPVSPKDAGAHIEAMSTTDLLVLFDTVEAQHQLDLAVA
jgi:hypothetical protein